MKKECVSFSDRRLFLRRAAATTGSVAFTTSSGILSAIKALAQDPPNGCPTPPTGGTPFTPGQDKRPVVLRKSINSFSPAELTELQSAFTKLRGLSASDPRTWVLQADLHALYCQQCSNDSAQIHGSWNFFPWHRAYLYYYERILGSLVSNLNGFRLPYWDWENIRTLPSSYATPSNSSNSLWDNKRNSGLAGGGNLPVSDGTHSRIGILDGITDFASVGGTVSGSGDCELNPHNIIHNDVGQPKPVYVDMGDLGFAARDPIFFGHHCNIDKVWSNWNALASGGGLPPNAYQNPTDTAFLNAQWSFYDENKNVVSITASNVLDHVNNLRYTYQQLTHPVIPIYVILECELIYHGPGPDPGPYIQVSEATRASLLVSMRAQSPVALVLQEVTFPGNLSGSFDILSVHGARTIQIGSFAFVHESGMQMKERTATLVLDVTHAIGDLIDTKSPASIRAISRADKSTFVLRAKSAQLRVQGKPQ